MCDYLYWDTQSVMLGCKKLKILTFTCVQSGQCWLFSLMWSFTNFEFAVLCCLGSGVCRTVRLFAIWKMNTFLIYASEVQQTEDDSVQFDDILRRIGEFGPWQRPFISFHVFLSLYPVDFTQLGCHSLLGHQSFNVLHQTWSVKWTNVAKTVQSMHL